MKVYLRPLAQYDYNEDGPLQFTHYQWVLSVSFHDSRTFHQKYRVKPTNRQVRKYIKACKSK